jgi:hypothetical protein
MRCASGAAIALLPTLAVTSIAAQTPAASALDSAARAEVVEALARELTRAYEFPAKAVAMERALRALAMERALRARQRRH